MDYVVARVKSKNGNEAGKMRLLLSNETIYDIDIDRISAIPYSPNTNIDDTEWFCIDSFSKQEYFIDFLREEKDSVSYAQFEISLFKNIDYLCSIQNINEYYFQKVSKTQLLQKKFLSIGNKTEYKTKDSCIYIKSIPDAIYIKKSDRLYFKELSSITSIFRGIDQIYKEATYEETKGFLEQDFIMLGDEFGVEKVTKPNRKRIALAIQTLENFEPEQKEVVFDVVKEYCPNIIGCDNTFKIETDDDLKYLLWGIEQRYYTTPDGKERRVANSIITLSN